MPAPLIGVIAALGGSTIVRSVAVSTAGEVVGGLVGGGDEIGAPTVVVSIESEKTLQQFDALIDKIADLRRRMPEVLMEWQREDMNRSYPFVEQPNEWTAETTIWPRSRRVRRSGERRARPRRRVSLPFGGSISISTRRPILRPELLDQLHERMREMLHEPSSWQ